ncbi:MAG: hypothetical protein H9855_01135 [Candidatus Acinetobacter avistercoris]|nr:hypothetical protein [Candidatus Acinetobacter avistercoris]
MSFEAYNSKGDLVISSQYQHWCFIKKVDLVAYNLYYTPVGEIYSPNVLVAFSPKVANTYTRAYFSTRIFSIGYPDPSTPTNRGLYLYSEVASTAYIFDLKTSPQRVNFGIEVFNSEGKITFNSAERYMRVLSTLTGQGLPVPSNPFTNPYGEPVISQLSGSKAIIPLSVEVYAEYYGAMWNGSEYETDEAYGLSYFSLNQNDVRVRLQFGITSIPVSRNFPGGVVETGQYFFIIIDVSEL